MTKTPREIKFRAWDKESEEMYFSGSGQSNEDGYPIEFIFENDGLTVQSYWDMGDGGKMCTHDAFVMQYTGLKDKYGVEIYEGDICGVFKSNSYLNGKKQVIWDGERGRWCYKGMDLGMRYQVGSSGNLKCEVIGNIYENPELLK